LNVGYTDIIVNVGELGSDMKANDPTNAYLARHELSHALVLPTPAYPPQMKKKWDEIFGNQRSAYVGII